MCVSDLVFAWVTPCLYVLQVWQQRVCALSSHGAWDGESTGGTVPNRATVF